MELQKLKQSELKSITGGSEASDNFLYSMGQLAGHIHNGLDAIGGVLGEAMNSYGNAYEAHRRLGGSYADWKQ